MRKLLKDYTTKVPPEQTISEIQQLLAGHNVTAMMTEYDGRQVSSVSFRINLNGNDMSFRLPCNWRGVHEILKRPEYSRIPYAEKEAQSIRVAWRIIKDWIDSQLAMVEVNMVTLPQVFLPYAVMRSGQTLSEHVIQNPQFLLGGKEESIKL